MVVRLEDNLANFQHLEASVGLGLANRSISCDLACRGSGREEVCRMEVTSCNKEIEESGADGEERSSVGQEVSTCQVGAQSQWGDLPDDILRIVAATLGPSYLRVMRLVCRPWAEASRRVMTSLTPEVFSGPQLAERFPGLYTLNCSECCSTVVCEQECLLKLQPGLTDEMLGELGHMPLVSELVLRGCVLLTGSSLSCLQNLPSLQVLDLSGCRGLADEALRQVAARDSLRSLDLRGCEQISDAGLAELAPLTSLQSLSLGGGSGITDDGLAGLSALTGLQELMVSRCAGVTDAGLAALVASLPSLRSLSVSRHPGAASCPAPSHLCVCDHEYSAPP